jgi:hypothetical protein
MTPITFTCRATLPFSPQQIVDSILDLANWPKFEGYGPLPGIKTAEFEVRTPEIVGTRIRVTSTDGSRHVEEIVDWQPEERLQQRMSDFSPPLSHLATHFVETWDFRRDGDATNVIRSFELHPRSAWTTPLLWVIARLLKRAVDRSLQQMKAGI